MNTITVEWEVFRDMCDCSNLDSHKCEHILNMHGSCSPDTCPMAVRDNG